MDENGQAHWLTDSAYDNTAKVLRFTTSHFSAYDVGYRQDTPALNDIGSHPAKNDILFAVSRGLLGSTGSTAFSPDTAQGWTLNDSGRWMYYENGSAAIGTHNIGGISYTFDQNGELASGF